MTPRIVSLIPSATEIVAAHVSNNSVSVSDLPQLINQVYLSLANVGTVPAAPAEPLHLTNAGGRRHHD